MTPKKVFVSGCYDLLHSGHVEFFRQAAEYGDLYVGIGSDKTILDYKHHKTVYSEQERLFMVKAIRYVKDAYINAGSGIMDFIPTVEALHPDILVVNEDGGNKEKELFCKEHGIASIAITCNGRSFLAKNCTLSIVLDMKEEAINDMPIPTSSCIMMLAVCDAITACVVKNKKFSKEDFYEFHSGGSIGKKIGAIIKRKGKKK